MYSSSRLPDFMSLVLLFFSVTLCATARTLYVDIDSPNPTPPYESWDTAAREIQQAIDEADDHNTIRVAAGTYDTGFRGAGGAYSNTTRVVLDHPVVVRSEEGAANTFIVGDNDPEIRCAYVCSNAILRGFTLTNGCAAGAGGGVLCETGGRSFGM